MSTHAARDRFYHLLDQNDQETEAMWESLGDLFQKTDVPNWTEKLQEIADAYMLTSRFAMMRICKARLGGSPETDWFEATVNGETHRFIVTEEQARAMGKKEQSLYQALLMQQYQAARLRITELERLDTPEQRKEYITALVASPQVKAHWNGESVGAVAAEVEAALSMTEKGKARLSDAELLQKSLNGKKQEMSREEAFRLAHLLDFSPEEMEFYLLRVFEHDACLRLNTSNDLMELYGLLIHADWRKVEILKRVYEKCTAAIPKKPVQSRADGQTSDAGQMLFALIQQCDPEERDAQFLNRMIQDAPVLDISSKTALTIYRNLAAFACRCIFDGYQTMPGESAAECFRDELRRSVFELDEESDETKAYFYENGVFSPEKCREMADALIIANQTTRELGESDLTKEFRYMQVKRAKPSVTGGIDGGQRTQEQLLQGEVYLDPRHIAAVSPHQKKLNLSRSRVRDLLWGDFNGREESLIDKGDMLYLLWLATKLYWEDDLRCENHSGGFEPQMSAEAAEEWIQVFIAAADECLKRALLPGFYPPHLLEQSMMMSLGYAGRNQQDPGAVYFAICAAAQEKKETKGSLSKKKAGEETVETV